jgi:hypothetical protein
VNSQLDALNNTASSGDKNPTGAPSITAEACFRDGFATARGMLTWRIRMQALYWLVDSKAFREACAMCHRFIDHYVAIALNPERLAAEKAARVKDGPEKYVHSMHSRRARKTLLSFVINSCNSFSPEGIPLRHCLLSHSGNWRDTRRYGETQG